VIQALSGSTATVATRLNQRIGIPNKRPLLLALPAPYSPRTYWGERWTELVQRRSITAVPHDPSSETIG